MRELRFSKYYTQTCEQLYQVVDTYYMTPHGNTPTIHIQKGRYTTRGHPITIPLHDIHEATTPVAQCRKSGIQTNALLISTHKQLHDI